MISIDTFESYDKVSLNLCVFVLAFFIVVLFAMEERGRAITEYFRSNPTNKNAQTVVSQVQDAEVALHVVQLLMVPFTEATDGLILLADVCLLSSFFIDIALNCCCNPSKH